MPTWVPDGRDSLDRLAADLAATFADAERRLTAALALQVTAALTDHPDDVARALNLGELRRLADQITTALRGLLPDQVDHLIQVATEQGAAAALSELSAATNLPDITTAPVPAGTGAAVPLVADLTNALDDVATRILRWPDDVYRSAVAQSATDMLLGLGATQSTVQARAWQQLIAQGVTGFTDQADRHWNLATYVEMASRTATHRAWSEQHITTLADHGVDLVTIAVGSGSCKACAAWAGKILRTGNGPTGKIQTASLVGDGQVTVNIAGTLAQARAAGWDHPNDRCRVVAYLPGLPVVTDQTTYDPEKEAARAKQRDLEVRTRKAKTEAAAAVTSEQRRAANAKARDLQTQIREHVEANDLVRLRDREQPNLGHKVATDGPTVARRG